MWAFACGVVSVGTTDTPIWRLAVGAMIAGPCVCAASQIVNDWFDREVDAINEPDRPIPSGRIPGRLGLHLAIAWSIVSLAVSALLGPWGMLATALALVLAWAYSAPPFRLKQNGWLGNAAVGLSYEGLAWITGATVALGGSAPGPRIVGLALLYSIGAHGIMTLNDFKSIRGDRRLGIRSLPAQLGPVGAARVACAVMLVPQLVVVALLVMWALPLAAAVIATLVAAQLPLMRRFLRAPVAQALFYSGFGVPIYVLGMMVAAVAIR
jgi:chlorophyll synthase